MKYDPLRKARRWARYALTTPLLFIAAIFTTVGKAHTIDKLDSTVSTRPEYVAWGTGAGTAAVGDATLFTEASEARTLGVLTQPAADTLRLVGTIIANGTKSITNAGSFTAASGGTLFIKATLAAAVAVDAADSITFTIDFQQT